jgi:hypothetical protein
LDKFKIWFMRLGWRPRGLPPKPPAQDMTRETQIKYDARIPAGLTAYVMAQYVVVVLLAMIVLNLAEQPLEEKAMTELLKQIVLPGALVVLSLGTTAGLFERKRWALRLEVIRLVLLAGGVCAYAVSANHPTAVAAVAVLGLLVSLPWLLHFRQLFANDEKPVPSEAVA